MFLQSPQKQSKIIHPPSQCFFENLFSYSRKEKENYECHLIKGYLIIYSPLPAPLAVIRPIISSDIFLLPLITSFEFDFVY